MQKSRIFAVRLVLIFLGLLALDQEEGRAQTVISYWNFNNDSQAFNSPTLGSLSTTAAAYGEAYNASTLHLAANSGVSGSYSTAYSGSGIYLDLSNFANANGGFASGGTTSGWGIYSDTTVGQISGDASTGGSLYFSSSSTALSGKYITFSLSGAGYQGLTLDYAERITSGATNSIAWSYSTDGTSWISLSGPTVTANSAFQSEALSLPAALDNTSSFYLRGTFTFSGASIALDNISLTGTAIAVPEPGMLGLILLGGGGLLFRRRRPMLQTLALSA